MEVKIQSIVVAVLPFVNSTNDQDIDYFVSGFTEDLIVDLSKFSALQVISSRSTSGLNGQYQEIEANIQSLQADYLVKGNFRKKADTIRLSVHLISTNANAIVWAERYDEDQSQLFDIQDDIIEQIVNTIQTQIDANILVESRKKDRGSLEAYDCWLRGMEQLKQGTVEHDAVARTFFEQALETDPDYARAYTGLSLSYFNEWSCQIWERWDVSKKGAFEYAQKAIAIDDNDYVAHSVIGQIYLFDAAYEKAEHHLRKSLNLNANDANVLSHIAFNFTFLGYTKEAEKLYLKALRLNPLKSRSYFSTGGLIYFELGQYEKSLDLWLKVDFNVSWIDLPANMAAAYFQLGNLEKMRHFWNIYLKQFQERILFGKIPQSKEAVQWLVNINPYRGESNILPFLEFMSNEEGVNWAQQQEPLLIGKPISSNIFRKGAGLWEISFGDKTVLLPHVKGYIDIAKLLAQPNQEIHCTELMGMPVRVEDEVLVLDEKAKQAYKKRLQELAVDLDEAEFRNDTVNALTLRKEYDELVDHLTKSLGLGGKSRKLSPDIDRARSAVTWRLRSAIKKIAEVHSDLGKHLSKSIETGTFCVYSPEKPVEWEI